MSAELKTEKVAYNTGATIPTKPTKEGYSLIYGDIAFDNIIGEIVATVQ
ncbi:MAG: hypothetical protein KHX91_09085 [Clostridium sp.]|nr:hypothetical protein [Clostridium sp.]